MTRWLAVPLFAFLALGVGGGCQRGIYTQEDIDRAAKAAGDTAAAKAKAEAEARLTAVFFALGKTEEEAKAAAALEAEKVADVARLSAEEIVRKAMEPLKKTEGVPQDSFGKILAGLTQIGLTLGLSYLESRGRNGG